MKEQAKKKPTVAILTGGGDVPGLNPCIKALVCRAIDEGVRVLGFRRGWAGLLEYHPETAGQDLDHCVHEFDKAEVRTIDRDGGTYLHTSRTNPGAARKKDVPDFLLSHFKTDEEIIDFTPHCIQNLETLGIDAVIPIGGDDTLSFAAKLG
jgi:6-phosphofructokinase